MNTIEDFENAPTGATATLDVGLRAMKIGYFESLWIGQNGVYMSSEQVEGRGFILEPPAPTTAQEALDLAWELAHEVKEGQFIPKGTRCLRLHHSGLEVYSTEYDFEVRPPAVSKVRTLEPMRRKRNTLGDFKNAPTGATATHGDGSRVMKMDDIGRSWITSNGLWCSDEQVWGRDFTLDPLYPLNEETE